MSKDKKVPLIFGVLSVDEVDSTVFLPEATAIENAQAYETLIDNEESYDDDEGFSSEQIPAYADGLWPGFPQRDQAEWFPSDLQKQYGVLVDTLHDGSMLQISIEHQENVVRALIGRGYQCARNDALIAKACGY